MADERDPLDSSSTPAISFKNSEPGDVKTIDVTDPCEFVQSRDYDTQELAFWPANKDGSPGGPKMAVVFNGTDSDGQPASLWAVKPSSLFAALADAQKTLGRRLGTGPNVDRIHVKHDSSQPPKSGRGNDQKVYKVKVTDAGPRVSSKAAAPDPFSDEPPF